MGRDTVKAMLLALTLWPVAGLAQQHLPDEPPANPGQVLPDQRLKIMDQRLLRAAETMKRAADDGDTARIEAAVDYGRQTVAEVRDTFGDLPQERRAPYEQAIAKAEQALGTGDAAAGAEAVSDLQRTLRDLAQRGA